MSLFFYGVWVSVCFQLLHCCYYLCNSLSKFYLRVKHFHSASKHNLFVVTQHKCKSVKCHTPTYTNNDPGGQTHTRARKWSQTDLSGWPWWPMNERLVSGLFIGSAVFMHRGSVVAREAQLFEVLNVLLNVYWCLYLWDIDLKCLSNDAFHLLLILCQYTKVVCVCVCVFCVQQYCLHLSTMKVNEILL